MQTAGQPVSLVQCWFLEPEQAGAQRPSAMVPGERLGGPGPHWGRGTCGAAEGGRDWGLRPPGPREADVFQRLPACGFSMSVFAFLLPLWLLIIACCVSSPGAEPSGVSYIPVLGKHFFHAEIFQSYGYVQKIM